MDFRDLRPSEDAQNLQFSNKADEVLVKLPGSINGKPFNIVNLNVRTSVSTPLYGCADLSEASVTLCVHFCQTL